MLNFQYVQFWHSHEYPILWGTFTKYAVLKNCNENVWSHLRHGLLNSCCTYVSILVKFRTLVPFGYNFIIKKGRSARRQNGFWMFTDLWQVLSQNFPMSWVCKPFCTQLSFGWDWRKVEHSKLYFLYRWQCCEISPWREHFSSHHIFMQDNASNQITKVTPIKDSYSWNLNVLHGLWWWFLL